MAIGLIARVPGFLVTRFVALVMLKAFCEKVPQGAPLIKNDLICNNNLRADIYHG